MLPTSMPQVSGERMGSRHPQEGPPPPRCPICGADLVMPAEASKSGISTDGAHGTSEHVVIHCPAPRCGMRLRVAGDVVSVDALRLVGNSSMCVLAFSFPETPGVDPWARLKKSDRWKRRTFSLTDPDDVDRTEYFLPYIRRFLFPTLYESAAKKPRAGSEPPTCEHYRFDLSRLGPMHDGALPIDVACDDVRKEMSYRYGLRLERIELLVFGYRCGFLVLKFRHPEHGTALFDQMNALVFLRHIAPQHRGFRLPELTVGNISFTIPQLLHYLLHEFGTALNEPGGPAESPSPPVLPVHPIYDDRMLVYTFSCLDRYSCLGDVEKNQALISRSSVIAVHPETGARVAEPRADVTLDAWRRIRWVGHSKDGGSLIVFNTDAFHEKFLGVYHGTYYFDVFLLAALQRVTLITLFDRLSDIGSLTTGSRESHRLLRRVRYDLLRFTNQCWFSQITNREKGQELSRKWQEVFENQTLMSEVHEQSGQLDSYLRNRVSEQVETLVRLGGFVATAVPAVLGLNVLLGSSPWVDNVKWGLLIALITGTGLFAWIRMYRQSRDV